MDNCMTEIEARARTIVGGAAEFDRKFPDGMELGDDAPDISAQVGPKPGSTCEHCGNSYTPRKGSGGKPQRFCSTECRMAFHAGTDKPQRSQRGPTCSDEPKLPLVVSQPANAQEATPEDEEFNWRTDDSVVLRDQPATAIYFNNYGSLVIRQERPWDREEDTYVFITRENIDGFLDKLCDIAGIPSLGR